MPCKIQQIQGRARETENQEHRAGRHTTMWYNATLMLLVVRPEISVGQGDGKP